MPPKCSPAVDKGEKEEELLEEFAEEESAVDEEGACIGERATDGGGESGYCSG